MSIWHILISKSVSVYGRYVVSLLLVWVRDYRSAVGVLMIGLQSVWCRLCIGLKSGDSIPNLTQDDPDMKPTAFTVSSATLSVADTWPIHCKFCGFCRFRVGLAGVTRVLQLNFYAPSTTKLLLGYISFTPYVRLSVRPERRSKYFVPLAWSQLRSNYLKTSILHAVSALLTPTVLDWFFPY